MDLGEKIYSLRMEKRLSQGDLADALDVSRQSISKWETNASVPELEKLIKLSQIFGVSLDELILDKKAVGSAAPPQGQVIYVERTAPTSAKKIVGIILLCFAGILWLLCAMLGGILEGLFFAAPIAVCGLICLLVRRYAGLWCCWTVYLFTEIYLRFATGINWQFIFLPAVYSGGWTIHLIIAWSMLAALITLTIFTTILTGKTIPVSLRKDLLGAVVSWITYIIRYIINWLLLMPLGDSTQTDYTYFQTHRIVTSISGWLKSIILVVALIFTIRLLCALWKKHKEK